MATPARPPAPAEAAFFHPDHVETYVATLRRGVDHVADALRATTTAASGVDAERAAKPVREVDLDRPLGDTEEVLAELSRVYLDDAVWFHDPSYAAHLNCPVLVPSLLAEVFVSAVNSSLDTFDQSVGGTFVERHVVDWTAARIGFGPDADGVFTSGGTQSNLQGLLLAREHAVAAGADPAALRVVTSTDGHFSVQKAARLLGLAPHAVHAVPVDDRRRMDPEALERTLAACRAEGGVVMAVVATAGTTDFGAIDPLPAVAAAARRHGAWLHVDAAYGGGLLVSATHRHRLEGIQHADSVTVDFHKTWFQSVSCSALVVREGRHLGHVTWHADYLNPRESEQPNQVDKSLQTTRRFDALKMWLTLRTLGPQRLGELVDDLLDLAVDSATAIRHDPMLSAAIELAAAPELSTLVVRYLPDTVDEATADLLVPAIRAAMYERGVGMVAATKVGGRAWLKLTLLNPIAEPADVIALLREVVRVGDELVAGGVRTTS